MEPACQMGHRGIPFKKPTRERTITAKWYAEPTFGMGYTCMKVFGAPYVYMELPHFDNNLECDLSPITDLHAFNTRSLIDQRRHAAISSRIRNSEFPGHAGEISSSATDSSSFNAFQVSSSFLNRGVKSEREEDKDVVDVVDKGGGLLREEVTVAVVVGTAEKISNEEEGTMTATVEPVLGRSSSFGVKDDNGESSTEQNGENKLLNIDIWAGQLSRDREEEEMNNKEITEGGKESGCDERETPFTDIVGIKYQAIMVIPEITPKTVKAPQTVRRMKPTDS
ncbi:hypothetical protein BDP27DRAFT_1365549 [Rhodocollybia butyracea]|uniref:Uncharacterized protein n=1 Tax=Rhodocollybia butyracea TaxID=206335 RepID=A0A9P5PRC4_9AGAR|nr:hypothetical protein BDP27DRAFT_1365549 [Rhodocollybia butyracea]